MKKAQWFKVAVVAANTRLRLVQFQMGPFIGTANQLFQRISERIRFYASYDLNTPKQQSVVKNGEA